MIIEMEKNIVMARNLFGRCETCMKNFQKSICAMTCSPDQSIYLRKNVTKVKVNNETIKYVSSVGYDIHPDYINAVYDSCRHVIVPATGGFAMDLACGHDNSITCSSEKWYKFMGDAEINPYVPFPINYNFTNASNAFMSETKRCNEPYPVRKSSRGKYGKE